MTKLKSGYFADGPWSHRALKRLLLDDTVQIMFICSRSDAPDEILKAQAEKNELDFITHANINSEEFLAWVRDYGCELFVSMSFNQIFKRALINIPPLNIINCHAGKLQFYR